MSVGPTVAAQVFSVPTAALESADVLDLRLEDWVGADHPVKEQLRSCCGGRCQRQGRVEELMQERGMLRSILGEVRP